MEIGISKTLSTAQTSHLKTTRSLRATELPQKSIDPKITNSKIQETYDALKKVSDHKPREKVSKLLFIAKLSLLDQNSEEAYSAISKARIIAQESDDSTLPSLLHIKIKLLHNRFKF